MATSLPRTPDEWLDEIELAYKDAGKTKPFALLTGQWLTNAKLFHLAPVVCMKFRGLDFRNEDLRKKVVEGALANFVANSGPEGTVPNLESRPRLAFAVCYVTAHHVLDLLDEQQTEAILNHCEKHLDTKPRNPKRRKETP